MSLVLYVWEDYDGFVTKHILICTMLSEFTIDFEKNERVLEIFSMYINKKIAA